MNTTTRFLGLHGPSGVGKDTTAERLRLGSPPGEVVHLKFALPLRAIVYELHGYDRERIGDKDYEEKNGITDALIAFNKVYRPHTPDLMVYGLQYCIWDYVVSAPWSGQAKPRIIVVSDVRQPNEYHYLKWGCNARVARLQREGTARKARSLDNLLERYPLAVWDIDGPMFTGSFAWVNGAYDRLPEGNLSEGDCHESFRESVIRLYKDVLSPSGSNYTAFSFADSVEQTMLEYAHRLNTLN
jgi:hypothetical protein